MNILDLLQAIRGCMHGVTPLHGLYVSLFFAGLVGGFTHCVVMCGPFILSQSRDLKKVRGAMLLPYHLGRFTTYMIMAVLFAGILNLAFLYVPIRNFVIAPILMTAGVVFFVTAFPSMRQFFPWVGRFNISIPYAWLSGGFQKLSRYQNGFSQYLMGILLGFMPCGLIVSVLMATATAPTLWGAALAMLAFGLGTLPALVSVSLGGELLHAKYPHVMQYMKQGAMVWSGLWLFIIAGSLLI